MMTSAVSYSRYKTGETPQQVPQVALPALSAPLILANFYPELQPGFGHDDLLQNGEIDSYAVVPEAVTLEVPPPVRPLLLRPNPHPTPSSHPVPNPKSSGQPKPHLISTSQPVLKPTTRASFSLRPNLNAQPLTPHPTPTSPPTPTPSPSTSDDQSYRLHVAKPKSLLKILNAKPKKVMKVRRLL